MLTPAPEVEIVKLSINMSVLISWSEFDIKVSLEIVLKSATEIDICIKDWAILYGAFLPLLC